MDGSYESEQSVYWDFIDPNTNEMVETWINTYYFTLPEEELELISDGNLVSIDSGGIMDTTNTDDPGVETESKDEIRTPSSETSQLPKFESSSEKELELISDSNMGSIDSGGIMDTSNTDDSDDEIGSEQLPSIFSLGRCPYFYLYDERQNIKTIKDPVIIVTCESEEPNLEVRIIKRSAVKIVEDQINWLLSQLVQQRVVLKTNKTPCKEISGVTFTEVSFSNHSLTSLTMQSINDLQCLRDELLKRRTLCTLPCIDVPESCFPKQILILRSKYISLEEYYNSGKTLSTDDLIQMLYQTLDFVKTLDRLNLCLQKTGLSDFCRSSEGNFFFVPLHLLKKERNPIENFNNYCEFIVEAIRSQQSQKDGKVIRNIKLLFRSLIKDLNGELKNVDLEETFYKLFNRQLNNEKTGFINRNTRKQKRSKFEY